MQNPPTTSPPQTLEALAELIDHVRAETRTFLGGKNDDHLHRLWVGWDRRLEQLWEAARQRIEVPISLVGSTGAGKSTLLNALIGARILPVGAMKACTAAVSEVGYAQGPYRARVDFVSRAAWQREIGILLEEANDLRNLREADSAPDPRGEMSQAIRDKVWAVYRPTETAQELQTLEGFEPIEPPEIRAALDGGHAEFSESDLDRFRKQVGQYLDSRHGFWPIVQRVVIDGPFANLQGGIRIIDLPGLNDPNEAREEITRHHLKTCRFVWIVFGIKRSLTRDIVTLMQTNDFFRQLVMDGRTDALTFVGTASDDLDPESAREEFGLDEDAETASVIAARNVAVRREVRHQLADIAHQLAQAAGEPVARGTELARRLQTSPVLTVSAREYFRLTGQARTQPSGLIDAEQTEIPALLKHLNQLGEQWGSAAHHRQVASQFTNLLEEIRCEAQSQIAALQQQIEIGGTKQKEVQAAVTTARTFLAEALQDSAHRLTNTLNENQAVLAERVKRAVERAERELHSTLQRWELIHHCTILAVCRRGGVYVSPKGKRDFPDELAKPILDGIAFAWSEYFGDRLQRTLDDRVKRLVELAGDFRRRLLDAFESRAQLPPDVLQGIDRLFTTTERLLRELLGQATAALEEQIIAVQRTLYEQVPQQVRLNMESAFSQAAQQKGAGMKSRMLGILVRDAQAVSATMFSDARDSLLSGVRALNDRVKREYEQMILAVERNAEMAWQNLVGAGDVRLAEAALERGRQQARELGEFAESLFERYVA